MHREIMKKHSLITDKDFVDHIDHCGFNNQKNNLRKCLKKENNRNTSIRVCENKSSLYKGVGWNKNKGKWFAQITCDRITYSLGYHDNEKYAAAVYNHAAKVLFKEFAVFNDVDVPLTKHVNIKKKSLDTSEYVGVSFYNATKKWHAEITVNYKKISLGVYDSEIDAAMAYNNYVTKYGLNRKLNIIND